MSVSMMINFRKMCVIFETFFAILEYFQDRAELLNEVRDMQKKAGRDRKRRKRGAKIVVDETKQPKLTKFGINRYPSERTIWENIQVCYKFY